MLTLNSLNHLRQFCNDIAEEHPDCAIHTMREAIDAAEHWLKQQTVPVPPLSLTRDDLNALRSDCNDLRLRYPNMVFNIEEAIIAAEHWLRLKALIPHPAKLHQVLLHKWNEHLIGEDLGYSGYAHAGRGGLLRALLIAAGLNPDASDSEGNPKPFPQPPPAKRCSNCAHLEAGNADSDISGWCPIWSESKRPDNGVNCTAHRRVNLTFGV
jgi:hypothetical protein